MIFFLTIICYATYLKSSLPLNSVENMFISTKINWTYEFYCSHFPRINRKIDDYFFYTKSPKIMFLKFHISF